MPTATKKPPVKRQRKRWVPDLKRYSNYRSSRSIYVPFDIPEGHTTEYSGKYSDPEAVVYSVCIALSRMFGFSMNLISLDMKAFMLKVVTEHTPNLCCSSLRAIMEGRVPGIPKPTSHDPVKNHYARTTLMMMDVMDTIVREYLREQEDGLGLLDGVGSETRPPDVEEQEEMRKTQFPTMQEQLKRKERERSSESINFTPDARIDSAIEDEETGSNDESPDVSGLQSEVPQEDESR